MAQDPKERSANSTAQSVADALNKLGGDAQAAIMQTLDWAYDKALDPGVKGVDSAKELAESYMHGSGTVDERAQNLVRFQAAKAATSGFVTGLGGMLTLPVTIPANLSSVLFLQMRLIAAIAIMGGYDVKDDKVKTLVVASIAGNAAGEVLREVGIKVGSKLTEQMIRSISKEVIVKINRAVGFQLVSKFSGKGMINLGKAVPIVGGVIGGSIDAATTVAAGKVARKIFIHHDLSPDHFDGSDDDDDIIEGEVVFSVDKDDQGENDKNVKNGEQG